MPFSAVTPAVITGIAPGATRGIRKAVETAMADSSTGNIATKDGPIHDRGDDMGGKATVKECPECGETYTGEVSAHTHKAEMGKAMGIRKALAASHPHKMFAENDKMGLDTHMISAHGLPNSGNMVGPVENGGPNHSSASALHSAMHRGFSERQDTRLTPYGLHKQPTSFPEGQFPKSGGIVGKVRSLLGKSEGRMNKAGECCQKCMGDKTLMKCETCGCHRPQDAHEDLTNEGITANIGNDRSGSASTVHDPKGIRKTLHKKPQRRGIRAFTK